MDRPHAFRDRRSGNVGTAHEVGSQRYLSWHHVANAGSVTTGEAGQRLAQLIAVTVCYGVWVGMRRGEERRGAEVVIIAVSASADKIAGAKK